MTAIIKKIKVGLSQEEIDDLKPSVIDLGELSGSPLKENHDVLDNIITPGLYTFIWMSTAFFMSVYNSGSVVIQRITDRFSSYYERRKSKEIWSFNFYDYSNGNTYTSSGDTSKKLYLIGAQTITDKGTRTYTHDTVYVDTDGHLYDSGKRVLTTADSVGGGTITGDYLPLSGGTITGNLSVGGNLVMNGGGNISGDSASFHTMNVATKLNLSNTKKITYDDTYEYTFPDKSGTVALLSDIQNETKLHVYETSNKVHNKDFHQVMLYALQNAPEEMPFAIRLIVGYSGNRYQFIGVKKNLGTTHRVYLLDLKTYYTYKSNEFHYQTDYSTITLDDITISMSRLIEGIPTSLAGFSSTSVGIYGTTLTSGLYSFNCLLDDGSYLNFTMDLNQNASYTQVSPIIKDWGEGAFERLSYYKGTLKYVDQDGQPLSSYNTIQIRRLYSY